MSFLVGGSVYPCSSGEVRVLGRRAQTWRGDLRVGRGVGGATAGSHQGGLGAKAKA